MDFNAKLVVLNSKTNGKDKLFRTVQYGCKLLWYLLWKSRSNKDYIEKLKKIEAAMSSTRKVLRFAKTHEMLMSALNSIHNQDYFYRYILTLCNINQACYLILDNILWLNSIGTLNLKNKKPLNDWCNKFWLFSSILYLARDIHDLISIFQAFDEEMKRKNDPWQKYTLNEQSGAYTSAKSNVYKTQLLKKLRLILSNQKNIPLLLDTAKNVADIFLPLNSLDFIKLSPGAQGLLGLISSIISLMVVWDSKLKL
ncbi:unnamed protein product [Brachionus calyciflorus]|uniref:Peroxisomal biogenesis factor 11 n=1 Tax=Brachionus calyciflorus TaxID=104777 RepID=A0A813S4E3_9BILA|nr:unnamed protein product [Brachionus calyciflorus]